eukprot:CFRG3704T1
MASRVFGRSLMSRMTFLRAETGKCSGATDVCAGANIYTTGSDPAIKPDSEYPEWLWGLLDPAVRNEGKDDPMNKKYWKSRRKELIKKQNSLRAKK